MKWENLLIELTPEGFKMSVALESQKQSEAKEKTYYVILNEYSVIDIFDWSNEKIKMHIDSKLEGFFDCDSYEDVPRYTVMIDRNPSRIGGVKQTF